MGGEATTGPGRAGVAGAGRGARQGLEPPGSRPAVTLILGFQPQTRSERVSVV